MFAIVVIVVVGSALACGKGAAPDPVVGPPAASTDVRVATGTDASSDAGAPDTTIFEQYTFAGSQATFTTKATAFTGIPIDTSVLERLVKTRLRDVEGRALRDLFDLAIKDSASKPARDLIQTLASLATEAADGDARSQTVLAALVRDGLPYLFVKLTDSNLLANDGCSDHGQRLDAAYLGLARSAYLHVLGFPLANGDASLTAECRQYSRDLSAFIDATAAHLIDPLTSSRLVRVQELAARVVGSEASASPCGGATGISLQVRGLLDLVGNALPAQFTLRDLKGLRDAFVRLRLEVTVADDGGRRPDAGPDISTCFDALNQFSSAFDTVLGTLATDTEDPIPLGHIQATVQRVGQFLHHPDASKPLAQAQREVEEIQAQLREQTMQKVPLKLPDGGKVSVTDFKTLTQMLDAKRTEVSRLLAQQADRPDRQIELNAISDLVFRVADGKSLRRGDVVKLLNAGKIEVTKDIKDEKANRVVTAMFDATADAVREDPAAPAGVRLDVPALGTSMLVAFREDDRPGLYLRATIGAGYAVLPSSDAAATPLFYEELGLGYRVRPACLGRFGKDLLIGPHIATSGLLFHVSSANPYVSTRGAVALGFALNAYRLLDFSLNAAWLPRLTDGPGDPNRVFGMLLGIQLPLADYVQALSEGPATAESEAKTTK